MTINKALERGSKMLKDKNINSAHLDAELLLSFVLKKTKEFFYSHPNYKLTWWQKKRFQQLIKKRSKNYPIAYILGYKEFYGLKFLVNKNVLVPRPETELLVETARRVVSTDPTSQDQIAEIGTGSACIAISLAKNNFSNIIATDISNKALKIAKKNSELHQTKDKVKFLKGDLLKPLQNKKIDILIANLPYLSAKYKQEKSIKFEPQTALYAGPDGLDKYRKLFEQISKLKNKPSYILIELNPEQVNSLFKYIKRLFPLAKIETKKDLNNLERVMIIKII